MQWHNLPSQGMEPMEPWCYKSPWPGRVLVETICHCRTMSEIATVTKRNFFIGISTGPQMKHSVDKFTSLSLST